MRELDRGHLYNVQVYPAKEDYGACFATAADQIRFRKRIGENYPGNDGSPYSGTTTQELLRVIIARSLYVDGQKSHYANGKLILACQDSIYDLERRAASQRGNDYLKCWLEDMAESTSNIEELVPCDICGHVFCRRH